MSPFTHAHLHCLTHVLTFRITHTHTHTHTHMHMRRLEAEILRDITQERKKEPQLTHFARLAR